MNFLRKMFGGVVVRPISLTNDVQNIDNGVSIATGIPVAADRGMAMSTVWACVNLIGGTISTLPLQVFEPAGEDFNKVARGHDLYRLLHDSPNADQTAVDFLDYLSQSIELKGNAYALQRRIGGRLVALLPLDPDHVSLRRLSNGQLEYRFNLDGKSQTVGADDILHIRGPGGGALGGMSTLSMARHALGEGIAANESAGAFYRNAMRPSVVLQTKEYLSKENRAELRKLIADDYQGASNAGRPFVAEAMTVHNLTVSPVDAQLLESRAFSIEEICRFFGVPPVMIGHTSKTTSWPQGVEQQVLLFLKFNLRRRLRRIEMAMQKQLLSAEDRARGISIEFNLEGLLRGDSASRSTFYQSGLQMGWMTINEVRSRENLPPVEGGSVPRMQMQNVPITEAGKQPTTQSGTGA